MECCYQPNCEEYAVTPMLVAPAPPCAPKYCDEEPACMPCLPRCQKPVYYCCTKEPPPKREYYCCTKVAPKRDCCPLPPQTVCCPVPPQTVCCRPRSTPPRHDSCGHGGPPPPQPQQQACNSCCAQPPPNKPVKTKYIIPCYRYEDGRIVRRLPVSAFKRNGMQDQEHSRTLGTANFLVRCPRDVSIVCDVRTNPVMVADPAKVPSCSKSPLGCVYLKKSPIEVSLEDILDE